jgi:hypothetical protein
VPGLLLRFFNPDMLSDDIGEGLKQLLIVLPLKRAINHNLLATCTFSLLVIFHLVHSENDRRPFLLRRR